MVQDIERMLAELHYKTALALQFLDEPEKALEHTTVSYLPQHLRLMASCRTWLQH